MITSAAACMPLFCRRVLARARVAARAGRPFSLAIRFAAVLLVAGASSVHAGDPTWNYAVQLSAVVSESPAQIALSWPEDTWATATYRPEYTVWRRIAGARNWGVPLMLGAGQTSYTDWNVEIGRSYEYQVKREFQDPAGTEPDHVAYGYILSGIRVPFPDSRGKVLLVVEDRLAAALADKIAILRGDLMGDGWTVTQINVSATDAPVSVRQRMAAEYLTSTGQARALFLLGHIPVVRSGSTAPDGHDPRALPTDSFYGDVNGIWTDANGDGVYDQDTVPSAVELEVGRVDLSRLSIPGVDDIALTGRYLDKDHAFRAGALRFPARALIGDRIGLDYNRAPGGGAYRTFAALFGPDAVARANIKDDAPDDQRWISMLRTGAYTWAFGSGSAGPGLISYLGIEGPYSSATSTDFEGNVHAAFYLLMGSFFLDWDQPDDLLNAALASETGGLGSGWSGRPSLIMHPMGLGETVGFGVRLTQNNDGSDYFSPSNAFNRGIHIAWMGDPTLRLDYTAPVSSLKGTGAATTVALSWQPSPDASGASVSYVVYRAGTPDGPFIRLTPDPIAETSFTDATAISGATYMVRAVRMQQSASGTFQNPSEGVIWTVGTLPSSPPVPSPVHVPSPSPGTVKLAIPLLFTIQPGTPQPGPQPPAK